MLLLLFSLLSSHTETLGDYYAQAFVPGPRFLQSQILLRLPKSGWDYKPNITHVHVKGPVVHVDYGNTSSLFKPDNNHGKPPQNKQKQQPPYTHTYNPTHTLAPLPHTQAPLPHSLSLSLPPPPPFSHLLGQTLGAGHYPGHQVPALAVLVEADLAQLRVPVLQEVVDVLHHLHQQLGRGPLFPHHHRGVGQVQRLQHRPVPRRHVEAQHVGWEGDLQDAAVGGVQVAPLALHAALEAALAVVTQLLGVQRCALVEGHLPQAQHL